MQRYLNPARLILEFLVESAKQKQFYSSDTIFETLTVGLIMDNLRLSTH